jgi:hypothetical protein
MTGMAVLAARSRASNVRDNAATESVFSTLATERTAAKV